MRERILIIEVNWLGDVIFSTPFIRAVREANPASHIACLVHPRCVDVLRGSPHLNEIIPYDEEGSHRGLAGKIKLIARLRGEKFDTAFILHRSFTKALIAFLAGIKERIGYPTKNRSRLLTHAVEGDGENIHKVEYFLNLAREAGIEPKSKSYEFFIKDPDRSYVRGMLKASGADGSGPLVVICPGGNWDPKRWPWKRFAELSDLIIQKYGARIAIAGADKDVALAEKIKSAMKQPPVITCARTTLKQLGALFEMSSLVIANDTGPMHIAVATGANVIALFGPTSPAITGPYGKGNYKVIQKTGSCEVPCYDFTCKANRCMEAITVEDVFKETERFLS